MPIRVEIVSPEKHHVDRQIDMVVLPGREGQIAAMPGHAPVMLQLSGGVVSLYEADRVVDEFFVSGGFADIGADRCTVLADTVRHIDELDAEAARERLGGLEHQWAQITPSEPSASERLELELQAVRAEIEAGS
nr:ATP synthase F1 subunit epsilon [uncultured Neokomagataea sp.]